MWFVAWGHTKRWKLPREPCHYPSTGHQLNCNQGRLISNWCMPWDYCLVFTLKLYSEVIFTHLILLTLFMSCYVTYTCQGFPYENRWGEVVLPRNEMWVKLPFYYYYFTKLSICTCSKMDCLELKIWKDLKYFAILQYFVDCVFWIRQNFEIERMFKSNFNTWPLNV